MCRLEGTSREKGQMVLPGLQEDTGQEMIRERLSSSQAGPVRSMCAEAKLERQGLNILYG